MNSSPLDVILNSYHENRLAHAFLIETDDQERCLDELKQILCKINCESEYYDNCDKCNLCRLILNNTLPNFLVIRPEGQNIKKNQVLELKQKFSTKPIFSKYNMYILMEAEKLNSASANTMLKFLEEPEVGILGFFFTNNKKNVIDTIKSRCQTITVFYNNVANDLEKQEKAIFYLKNLHSTNNHSLALNRDFLNNFWGKEDYSKWLKCIFQIYYKLYRTLLNLEKLPNSYYELKFLLKKDPKFFLKQMKLIEELESELRYNVNINLLLDRLVLESR